MRLFLFIPILALVACSGAETKEGILECSDPPSMCGCPGSEYESTECVDGEWFCPGPNGCPGGNVTTNNATTVNNTTSNNTTSECDVTSTSSLEGVSIAIQPTQCSFSLAELEQGVTFEYSYEITQAHTILPGGAYSCFTNLDGMFPHAYRIEGDMQQYCLCDVGLCQAPQEQALVPGTYSQSFEWTGRNWNGPSDFNAPMGEPFPAGEYTLLVRSDGTLDGAEWEVTSSMPITITQ